MSEQQATADLLMIRPAAFASNAQTAESNRFQNADPLDLPHQDIALSEFDELAAALRAAGVQVHVFDDTPEPVKPDAIFPNNWVSFHADGTAVLYPMLAENRRRERRMDVLEDLSKRLGFRIDRVIDLSHFESQSEFLEGTGSLVLDRANRLAYASLSPRTHLNVLGEFAQLLDYELVTFESVDRQGVPVYHTNVMLSVGRQYAAICADAIRPNQREAVLKSLGDSGHRVLELTYDQMNSFAGNMLEVTTGAGAHVLALSRKAANSLTSAQRELLTESTGQLLAVPIPTIERLGGGSVRCMLAEVFLPRK